MMSVKKVRILTNYGEFIGPSPDGPQRLWSKEDLEAVAQFQRDMLEIQRRANQQSARKE